MAPAGTFGKSVKVMDAIPWKRHTAAQKIHWKEVYAEVKNHSKCSTTGLPDGNIGWNSQYLVSIKGPLTTPVGGGSTSLNVALRQMLDLYVCCDHYQYFAGVPSPVETSEKVDMVISEKIPKILLESSLWVDQKQCQNARLSSDANYQNSSTKSDLAAQQPVPGWDQATGLERVDKGRRRRNRHQTCFYKVGTNVWFVIPAHTICQITSADQIGDHHCIRTLIIEIYGKEVSATGVITT